MRSECEDQPVLADLQLVTLGELVPDNGQISWKTDVESELVIRFQSTQGLPLTSDAVLGGAVTTEFSLNTTISPHEYVGRWHEPPPLTPDFQLEFGVTETTNAMSKARIIVLPRRKTGPIVMTAGKLGPVHVSDRPPRQGR